MKYASLNGYADDLIEIGRELEPLGRRRAWDIRSVR